MIDARSLARIRLVSRRYVELQGRSHASIGVGLAVPFGVYVLAGGEGEAGFWVVAAVAGGLTAPLHWAVSRLYRAEYGSAVPEQRSASGGLLFGVFLFAVMKLEEALLGHSEPRLTLFLLGVPFFLWIVVRDWPFRHHHLLTATACGLAAGIQFTAEASRDPWSAAAAGIFIISLAMVPAGFRDHRLLASVMHRQRQPDSVTEATREGERCR